MSRLLGRRRWSQGRHRPDLLAVETFSLSIDVEAELAKIAARHYLSDVHHVVQMVRHAVRRSPSRIDVVSTPWSLRVSQDGQAFPVEERDLLRQILRGEDAVATQAAVSVLEERFGTTMLALALRFAGVEIESDRWRLVVRHGAVRLEESAPRHGYRVEVSRRLRRRSEERRQLSYFCTEEAVPVSYNGRVINTPLRGGGIVTVRADQAHGRGELAVPWKGRHSRLELLTHGIRFGLRKLAPGRGPPVEAWWNSLRKEYEPTFGQSIQDAEAFVISASDEAYDGLARACASLPKDHRERVREMLLEGSRLLHWEHLPLFDSVGRSFCLSLADLRALARSFGAIPCVLHTTRRVPRSLPLLQLPHVRALRRLGHEVMVVPPGPRVRPARAASRIRRVWGLR